MEQPNRNFDFVMAYKHMTEVDQQRDLGIQITNNLKWNNQAEARYKKGNRVHGGMSRNFYYKFRDIELPVYTSLPRPHAEFAVQFWLPQLGGEINKMERVRHGAKVMMPAMRNKTYST